jgi:hypothetical protein
MGFLSERDFFVSPHPVISGREVLPEKRGKPWVDQGLSPCADMGEIPLSFSARNPSLPPMKAGIAALFPIAFALCLSGVAVGELAEAPSGGLPCFS